MNYENIKLDKLSSNIFSEIAEEAAKSINDKKSNKSTQLRKFYDELDMWYEKVIQANCPDEEYVKLAPFIHMMKSKVAYSYGREHVNRNFYNLFNQLIGEIKDPITLQNAKLFFEALLGFKKASEEESKR